MVMLVLQIERILSLLKPDQRQKKEPRIQDSIRVTHKRLSVKRQAREGSLRQGRRLAVCTQRARSASFACILPA